MKAWIIGVAVLAGSSVCSVAAAQDASAYTTMAFMGEAIGGASQPGVRVSAAGHARSEAFAVNVEGSASSAVQAGVIRDARLAQLREIAQRYGLAMTVGPSGFSREVDTIAQAKALRDMQAGGAGAMVNPFDPTNMPMLFVARTSVQISRPAPDKMATVLDALKGAGIEDLSGVARTNPYGAMLRVNLPGDAGAIDDVARDRAAEAAMADAHRQAEKLAAAAGRTLGPVEQVIETASNTAGEDVTVTLSVRFAFAPEK